MPPDMTLTDSLPPDMGYSANICSTVLLPRTYVVSLPKHGITGASKRERRMKRVISKRMQTIPWIRIQGSHLICLFLRNRSTAWSAIIPQPRLRYTSQVDRKTGGRNDQLATCLPSILKFNRRVVVVSALAVLCYYGYSYYRWLGTKQLTIFVPSFDCHLIGCYKLFCCLLIFQVCILSSA